MTSRTNVSPLERVLALSLTIIRTLADTRNSLQEQGKRIQRLNSKRSEIMESSQGIFVGLNAADKTRVALIQYLGKVADEKIRRQI